MRRYLQWIDIFPDGHEEPQQLEYSNDEQKLNSMYTILKDTEGITDRKGNITKKGSVRIAEFDE
jgi:hypothetical protein